MAHIIVGLSMGIVFGFLLEKSRVFEPAALIRQFQLRNFLMVKVFFTAIATSMLSIAFLRLSLSDFAFQLKPVQLFANAAGGLLLGFGVALTGACPGTVLAQLGAGYRDAMYTFVGGLVGATCFALLGPLLAFGGEGHPITFSHILGVPFEWLAVAMVALIVGVLVALERRSSWQRDVGVHFDAINT